MINKFSVVVAVLKVKIPTFKNMLQQMQAKQYSEYPIPFHVTEKAATSAEQAYIFNNHSNCQDCLPNFVLEPWFGWTMVWGTPGMTLLSAIYINDLWRICRTVERPPPPGVRWLPPAPTMGIVLAKREEVRNLMAKSWSADGKIRAELRKMTRSQKKPKTIQKR